VLITFAGGLSRVVGPTTTSRFMDQQGFASRSFLAGSAVRFLEGTAARAAPPSHERGVSRESCGAPQALRGPSAVVPIDDVDASTERRAYARWTCWLSTVFCYRSFRLLLTSDTPPSNQWVFSPAMTNVSTTLVRARLALTELRPRLLD